MLSVVCKTKGSYTDGKLTATRDGNDYTITGGELEGVFISSFNLNANGKIYFNGVQMDDLNIYADEGKYYVVLDKNTKADKSIWLPIRMAKLTSSMKALLAEARLLAYH